MFNNYDIIFYQYLKWGSVVKMKKTINITVADPAGNITIFVKDRFDRKYYPTVANQLLDIEELKGEQVAYILDLEGKEGLPKMEMCGLEFCGNASRSFALLAAKAQGRKGNSVITIDVSGSDTPLDVEVNTDTNYTKIKMPKALRVFDEEIFGIPAQIADYGGIMHVVVKNIEATEETFNKYKDYINEKYNPPAMGVMFWDEKTETLAPVVYVKDVDTTYLRAPAVPDPPPQPPASDLRRARASTSWPFLSLQAPSIPHVS
jgi:diaminopimelate epimerase